MDWAGSWYYVWKLRASIEVHKDFVDEKRPREETSFHEKEGSVCIIAIRRQDSSI